MTRLSKILLAATCLVLITSFAYGKGVYYYGAGTVAGDGCDSCTGALVHSWHCEDVDVTADSPCGCSDFDTSATLTGGATISGAQFSDGDESLLCDANGEYARFDITGQGLDADGTITFDLRQTTQDAYDVIAVFYGDVDDMLRIRHDATDAADLDVQFLGNTAEVQVILDCTLSTNTWYSVTIKWRQGASDPSLYVEANSVNNSSNTDLTDPATDWTALDFGLNAGNGAAYHIDNIKVYDTWQ